jgi:large subunit ribosomal protein L17
MRHLNAGRKFDRDGSSRAAMFKNLVANLFANERIETTVPKAKEVRRIAERLITRAARLGPEAAKAEVSPALAAQRLALKRSIATSLPRWGERLVAGEPERIDVVEHLFREIAPRFIGRPGGYTRILKTRNRRGDNAEMAIIELVTRDPNVGKARPAAEPAAATGTPVEQVVRSAEPRSRKEGEEPSGDAQG